jgi:hypothetical protein
VGAPGQARQIRETDQVRQIVTDGLQVADLPGCHRHPRARGAGVQARLTEEFRGVTPEPKRTSASTAGGNCSYSLTLVSHTAGSKLPALRSSSARAGPAGMVSARGFPSGPDIRQCRYSGRTCSESSSSCCKLRTSGISTSRSRPLAAYSATTSLILSMGPWWMACSAGSGRTG